MNIEGITIHSYLNLKLEFDEESTIVEDAMTLTSSGITKGDQDTILILDEVSMLGQSVFDRLLRTPYKLLILVGDKEQLPPVNDEPIDLLKYKTIELTEQMRTEESNTFSLIQAVREHKQTGKPLDLKPFIDGKSVKLMSVKDIQYKYQQDKHKRKVVLTYTNNSADDIIKAIDPKDHTYNLLGSITAYDGKQNIQLAVNGQSIHRQSVPFNWKYAQQQYYRLRGKRCTHRTKWKDDYPFKVNKWALTSIDTHFVRLVIEDKELYKQTLSDTFDALQNIKKILKNEFGNKWAENKTEEYRELLVKFMDLKNNITMARHTCAMTIHKSQGQSIDSVYVLLDKATLADKDLLYVALSRAKKEITLICENEEDLKLI